MPSASKPPSSRCSRSAPRRDHQGAAGASTLATAGLLSGRASSTASSTSPRRRIRTGSRAEPQLGRAERTWVATIPGAPCRSRSTTSPRSHRDTLSIRKVFFTDNIRFQYPPSALFGACRACWPWTRSGCSINDVETVPGRHSNTVVGWVFTSDGGLGRSLARTRPCGDAARCRLAPARALRALVVVGLTLTFYPVAKAFTLGQIQVWINAPVRARPALPGQRGGRYRAAF